MPDPVAAARQADWEALSFRLVMGGLAGLALLLLLAPTVVVLVISFTSGLSLVVWSGLIVPIPSLALAARVAG